MSDVAAASPNSRVAELYARFRGFVGRALGGLGVPAPDVEDLTQDVFITLHRRDCTFVSDREARSWLYGTARRIASNHRRAERRAERRAHRAPRPSATPSPDALVEGAQALSTVERFTCALSPDAKAAFRLAAVEGLSGPDVAARLGLPLNTAYSHIRRARTRLKQVLLAVTAVLLLALSMLAGRCATEVGSDGARVALRASTDAAG